MFVVLPDARFQVGTDSCRLTLDLRQNTSFESTVMKDEWSRNQVLPMMALPLRLLILNQPRVPASQEPKRYNAKRHVHASTTSGGY